jgi:hypothetical protein
MDRKDPAHAGGEPLGAAIAAQVVKREGGVADRRSWGCSVRCTTGT